MLLLVIEQAKDEKLKLKKNGETTLRQKERLREGVVIVTAQIKVLGQYNKEFFKYSNI